MSTFRTTEPRRAFALLLVVLIVAALAILATPFMVSMRLQERSSRKAVGRARARYAVTAAFNHALAQLIAATHEYGEFAVSFGGLPDEFEWSTSERSLLVAAEVQDEQGKINVNTVPGRCLAVLFAAPELGLDLTAGEASDRAVSVTELRAENGPLPTLHSLVTGGVFTENQLVALRPHITVHSAAEGDNRSHRVNVNTASTPVFRAVLAGVRLWALKPAPDPANTGNGAMSLVELIMLEDESGVWEVRCTNVQTDADTGGKTFTFASESYPENAPGTQTDHGTFTFAETWTHAGGTSVSPDWVRFSIWNGTTDFAVGDKFTFNAERFSYVSNASNPALGDTFDPTEVDRLLKWFRASVVSADVDAGTITLDDASKFPASGHVRVRGDVIQYASRSGNVLEGCTDIAVAPSAGNTVALIVSDMAAFDARLGEAVAAGDLAAHDRAALLASAKNPAGYAASDSTAGFCFMPSGRYSVEAQGIVSDAAGNTVQKMHIRRIISLEHGGSSVWMIRSQEEFDRAVGWPGEVSGLLTLPGASYLEDVAPSAAAESGVTLAPREEPVGGWSFNDPILFGATNWAGVGYGPATPGTTLVPGEDIYRDGDPGLFITGTKAFRCFARPAELDTSGGTRSLLVWVKPDGIFSYNTDHIFFDTGPDDSTEHVNRIRLFWSADGKLVFRISDEAKEPRSGEVRAVVGQAAFERETWHRIEAVWNGMDIGRVALLLDGRLIGSYSPSGDDAEATAAPALAGEKWIARVGNTLRQQDEADPVRGTQAGTNEPKSVYGYGICKFINKDASTRKGDFNKVHRGGATLAEDVAIGDVTTLHAALTAAATAIQVDDATNFPGEGYVKIGDEIIKYTAWELVEIEDANGNVTETYYTLTVPADGRGQDLGDNVATRAQSDAAEHAAGAEVLCISVEVSDASDYPMPHFFDVPQEIVDYFGLSGLDPGTCLVQVEDEWISYTHRAEDKFLVNARATARDLPGGTKTTTMRGAGGTDVAAHDADEDVLPVYSVTAGGRPGNGDRVTVLHDGLDPDDHEELVIKRATTSGGTLVAFPEFIPGTHDLCIKKGSALLGAGFIKFPSGRYAPQRLASIGAPVSGAGKRADSTIGSVRVHAWPNSTTRRIKEAVDGSTADGFNVTFGSLDSLYDGGTQWEWSNRAFGVGTWPLEGFIKIDDEAFFYKVRYPHNIGIDAKLGAVSRSASTTVGGAGGIPATGDILWTKQAAEQDPIELGFNPHGGYLVITSYSRTKADDAVNSLESCTQEVLQWLIAEGHVTQAFVDQHGTFDAATGIWSFDEVTVEGGWTTTETKEFVRYTSITPATPGAAQYTFHCDASGRHLYGTHMDAGNPLGHTPADDGEGGMLHPTLEARTAEMTILRRGAASGVRALGTARAAHPAGSRLLPLPNVPATIISGPPVSEDFAVSLPYEADKIPVEDASRFPDSGYVEVTNAANRREIIYYTGKEEAVITGSDPERKQQYLTGVRHFRGRFGTTPVDLTGLAAFDDVRNTSAAQIAAYSDARRIVTLVQPRLHDRMPLLITMDGTNETERVFTPHDPEADLVYFEATKTVRGAKWLSVDWTETVPENTDLIVLARVGGSPSWLSAEPVMWNNPPEGGGRVILKFDAPKTQGTDNAINAAGDTITIRVFFKFNPGYDTTKWEAPVLKSLTVTYEAGTSVIESEVLDY